MILRQDTNGEGYPVTQRYHNPFAVIDLVAPIDQREYYDRYSATGSGVAVDINRCPFPRKVDFWFAALALAGHKGLPMTELAKLDTFTFIEGSIFDRDNWRVHAVMLVAIAIEGNVDVVRKPRRMMAIANGLAAAGVPDLVDMLRSGDQPEIWNLSDSLKTLLSKD